MDCTAAGSLACAPGAGAPDTLGDAARPERARDASLCLACPVRGPCIGSLAAQAGTRQLQEVLGGWRRLRAGEPAYRADEAGRALYAVRSGALKTVVRGPGGDAVRGFHFAGEVVGAAGLASGRPGALVVALEPTELCALRWGPPSAGAGRVWDMASRELLRERVHAAWLATLAPERRVAAFLASLAPRLRAGAGSRLPLPVPDVASYLDVAQELVGGG